jgi:hypothetical protein
LTTTKQTNDHVINDRESLALADDAHQILDESKVITILTDNQYRDAAETLKRIKSKAKAIDERRVYLKAPVLEQGRRIDEFFREPLTFLSDAEREVKRAMLDYTRQLEKKRDEAEKAAADEVAAKRAALAREADALRARASMQISSILEQADEADKRGDQARASMLMAKADHVAESLDVQVAMTVDRAADVVKPAVTVSIPRVVGQSTSKIWKFRIINEDDVPDEYKLINEKLLAQVARTTKGSKRIPGVEFYAEDTLSSTSY